MGAVGSLQVSQPLGELCDAKALGWVELDVGRFTGLGRGSHDVLWKDPRCWVLGEGAHVSTVHGATNIIDQLFHRANA